MDADGRTRETVYADWLQARIGDAAKIEHARLVKIARTFVARGGRAVEGPDAILQGALTIGDPGAFSLALSAGVGRHRSYGFGMILLRPAGRPAPAR
jgi:CRISPR system Cascade subunit CasE